MYKQTYFYKSWMVQRVAWYIFHNFYWWLFLVYLCVNLSRHKDEAFHKFKTFKASIVHQLRRKVKPLRTDGSGEYFSSEFYSFYEENGIIHQRSMSYTQPNNLAKINNRTLVTWLTLCY